MLNNRTFRYFMASVIVFIVVFSGCVSKIPSQTPTQTATPSSTPIPTQVAPVSTTVTQTQTPIATSSVPPGIKVTFYPFSVNGGTNITMKWEVSGGTQGEISDTAVLWGYKSGGANISEYPRVSKIQTGRTPKEFSADITAPSGGNFYFRAHAVIDRVNVYSPEYQITIIAPMGGGGGY